jgi:hypothetical protein
MSDKSYKMSEAEARAKAEHDRPIIAKLTLALTDRTTIEQLSASGEGARRVRLPGMLARRARAAKEEQEARELAEQMEKEANTKGQGGKANEEKEEDKGDEAKAEEQQTSG